MQTHETAPSLPAWQTEIIELHHFFEGWLGGTLSNDAATFDRFVSATSPTFTMITPRGDLLDYAAIRQLIANLYGTRSELRIWIEQPRLLLQNEAISIVCYEEHQQWPENRTARLATAIFTADPAAPNGVRWEHVHETWAS
jgi:hypothetical protein